MRYQSERPRRQFLAGVACPKCQTIDTVVQVRLFGDAPDEYIECTHCHHQERRPNKEDITKQNALTSEVSSLDISVTGTQGKVRFIK